MNSEQVKKAVRWFVSAFGIGIAAFIAGKGWASAETVTAVLTSEAFIGAVASGAMLVWGLIAGTEKNQVLAVDNMAKDPGSPVKGVILTNTVAGFDLAKAIPGTTTVVAGTGPAKEIAATGATS